MLAAIQNIIDAFISAANAFLAMIGSDFKFEIDPEVSETIGGWFNTIVNG